MLLCPHCSGTRVLVAIHEPDSVRKVLGALGLSAAVPELAHVPRAGERPREAPVFGSCISTPCRYTANSIPGLRVSRPR